MTISSSKKIKTAIIIPFYNGDHLIEACVFSILRSSQKVEKIYIIDNSTKATKISSLFANTQPIEIIKTQPAIGFGRACNIGINAAILAQYDIAILMNQDAIFSKNTIALLSKHAMSKKTFATVPISYHYDFSSIHPLIYFGYLKTINGFITDKKKGTLKEKYQLTHTQANGSCLAINLDAVKKLPWFDPIFHMYGEDNELFHRMINKYQLSLYLIPSAKIGHKHSQISNTKDRNKINSHGRFGSQVLLLKDNMWSKFAIKTFHTYFLALKKLNFMVIGLYLVSDFLLITKIFVILNSRDTSFLAQQIKKHIKNDQIDS